MMSQDSLKTTESHYSAHRVDLTQVRNLNNILKDIDHLEENPLFRNENTQEEIEGSQLENGPVDVANEIIQQLINESEETLEVIDLTPRDEDENDNLLSTEIESFPSLDEKGGESESVFDGKYFESIHSINITDLTVSSIHIKDSAGKEIGDSISEFLTILKRQGIIKNYLIKNGNIHVEKSEPDSKTFITKINNLMKTDEKTRTEEKRDSMMKCRVTNTVSKLKSIKGSPKKDTNESIESAKTRSSETSTPIIYKYIDRTYHPRTFNVSEICVDCDLPEPLTKANWKIHYKNHHNHQIGSSLF